MTKLLNSFPIRFRLFNFPSMIALKLKKKSRLQRKVKIMTLIFFGLLLFFWVGMNLWFRFRFEKNIDKKVFVSLVEEIKSSPPLPKDVLVSFAEFEGYSLNRTTTTYLNLIPFKLLFSDKNHSTSPAYLVTYPSFTSGLDRITAGIYLDQELSGPACLSYYLNDFDFGFGQIGIRKASQFIFHKLLNHLTKDELLFLFRMTNNPSLYNPQLHPEN